MKKIIKITAIVLLAVSSFLMFSCQDESIEPNASKEGNIIGHDDWQKQV
ncbi:MAG: hypothetical protein J0L67_06205 [Cytophagales bacterium]|nr:hypothetical protein [Cytophagales bacterium]